VCCFAHREFNDNDFEFSETVTTDPIDLSGYANIVVIRMHVCV